MTIICFCILLQLVGYMPNLGGKLKLRKSPKYVTYNKQLYHDVLREGLKSVKDAQRRGGITLKVNGEEKHFYPYVSIVVNDNPEGQLLCLIRGSSRSHFPCRMCG